MAKAKFNDEDTAHGLDPENVPEEGGAMAHSTVPVGGGEQEYALVVPASPDKVAEVADALNRAAVGREQVVQWTGDGFRVPVDVAEAANFDGDVAKLQNDLSSSTPTGVANPRTGLAESREVAQAQHEASVATGTAVGQPTGDHAGTTTGTTTGTTGGDPDDDDADGAPEDSWPTKADGTPDFGAMKIGHMRAYAKAHNIDLDGATRKEEIRARIEPK